MPPRAVELQIVVHGLVAASSRTTNDVGQRPASAARSLKSLATRASKRTGDVEEGTAFIVPASTYGSRLEGAASALRMTRNPQGGGKPVPDPAGTRRGRFPIPADRRPLHSASRRSHTTRARRRRDALAARELARVPARSVR